MNNSAIYVDPEVQGVRNIFDDVLGDYTENHHTKCYLEQLANRLFSAYESKSIDIKFIVAHHLQALGVHDIFSPNFSIEHAKLCIAREHSFSDWRAVESSTDRVDPVFESLVDSMLMGDMTAVKNAIKLNPNVVHQKSGYPHQATLLHYTGSNGVEAYRQVVPMNLAEIVDFLLNSGAAVDTKANLYGGCTAQDLLETSKHPYESGVIQEVLQVYRVHQAA